MVMHWLMQSIADMHVLRTLVAHGSSGLHFFMVITLLVMIILYSCQANYLSYDMGGTFGKVTMQMVKLWILDYVMV